MKRIGILFVGILLVSLGGCDRGGRVTVNAAPDHSTIGAEPVSLSARQTSPSTDPRGQVRASPKHVSESQFRKHVHGSELVLVKFGATWCPPCRLVDAELDRVAANSRTSVKILKVDIDDEPDLASKYGVGPIPRIFLLHGGKRIGDWTGFQSAEELEDAISRVRTKTATAGDVQSNPYAI